MDAPAEKQPVPDEKYNWLTRADAVLLAILASVFVIWVCVIIVRMRTAENEITIRHGDVEAATYRIDLNTAGAAELQLLPGIGPKRAERVTTWRAQHGPFRDLHEFRKAAGISERNLQRIRPSVTLSEGAAHDRNP